MTVSVTLEFVDAASAAAYLQGSPVEAVAKPAKASKAKAAPESVPPAATPAPAAKAPAAQPAQSPEAPTFPPISKVNDAISKLAGEDRAAAVAILTRHGAQKTPQLKQEVYQAVIDDAEEALAKLNAASVNASLV